MATKMARHRPIYFDSHNRVEAGWNPLHGCDQWEICLQRSSWLTDATQEGGSEIASYWRGEWRKIAWLALASAIGKKRRLATFRHLAIRAMDFPCIQRIK